ncbi:MAG: hypothetical protein M3409_04755 [Gemmatimonadota bacterium]|jgi:hypothetical protein|nr:hypothetical protein [Gemmatimonadota bacterium]
MKDKGEITTAERAILELLSIGAWISIGEERGNLSARVNHTMANPPEISYERTLELAEAGWIEENTYDSDAAENDLERPKYVLSDMGREYLLENPDLASAIPTDDPVTDPRR